jgi:DDE superfamily endonuclease
VPPPPPAPGVHQVLEHDRRKTPAVQRWLAKHPEYHLHFTPTSASWLNQVERVFADLTEKQLRRGVFTSVASLEIAAADYIDARNEDTKPFTWTANANTILGRVAKNRASSLSSPHSETRLRPGRATVHVHPAMTTVSAASPRVRLFIRA